MPPTPTNNNPGSTTAPATQDGQQSQAAARPEYVPEAHWDATAGKLKDEKAFASFVNEHVAFKAAEDVKRLTLPAAPEGYEVKLPADFKAPEGIKADELIKQDNPLWAQARSWAHRHGLSQAAFQEGIALIAGDKVGTTQQVQNARDAELGKLGAAATARVTAVNTWLDAMGVPGLKGRMWTAGDVQAMEGLITKFSNQGGASFRGTGRVPPEAPGKVDDATYEKMNYSERKAYAERHSANGAGR